MRGNPVGSPHPHDALSGPRVASLQDGGQGVPVYGQAAQSPLSRQPTEPPPWRRPRVPMGPHVVVAGVLDRREIGGVGSRATAGDLVQGQHRGNTRAAIRRRHMTCAYSVVRSWGGGTGQTCPTWTV